MACPELWVLELLIRTRGSKEDGPASLSPTSKDSPDSPMEASEVIMSRFRAVNDAQSLMGSLVRD